MGKSIDTREPYAALEEWARQHWHTVTEVVDRWVRRSMRVPPLTTKTLGQLHMLLGGSCPSPHLPRLHCVLSCITPSPDAVCVRLHPGGRQALHRVHVPAGREPAHGHGASHSRWLLRRPPRHTLQHRIARRGSCERLSRSRVAVRLPGYHTTLSLVIYRRASTSLASPTLAPPLSSSATSSPAVRTRGTPPLTRAGGTFCGPSPQC